MKRENLTLAVAGLCVGGLIAALVSQHRFGMEPCAWCAFQRLIYLLIAIIALMAWGLNRGPVAKALSWIGAALSVGGLATALYQQFVASQTQSCAQTFADLVIKGLWLDELAPWFFKARAFCNEANIPMAGVPYAIWSAVLFAVLAVILVIRARRPR
ncbi:MAG: disulfide bond formation protein B [Burkholderiaceae bacterium]